MARPPRSRSRPRRLPQTLHNGFQTYKEKLRRGGAKLSPGVSRKRRNAAFSSFWGGCFSVCARMARSATRNPPEGFRFDARAVRAGWKKGRGQATANGLGAGNRPFFDENRQKDATNKNAATGKGRGCFAGCRALAETHVPAEGVRSEGVPVLPQTAAHRRGHSFAGKGSQHSDILQESFGIFFTCVERRGPMC